MREIKEIKYDIWRFCENEKDHLISMVAELSKSGMSDAWILKNIGMDAEELLRLKQLSGLQELFKDKDFSKSWE